MMSCSGDQQTSLDTLFRASFFTGIGKLGDIFIRYLSSMIAARVLGAWVFGLFILGRTIVWVIASISQMGMGLGAVRQIAYFTARKEEGKVRHTIRLAIFISIAAGLLSACLVFLFADKITLIWFKKPELSLPLKVLLISIPIVALSNLLLDVLRGLKKIDQRVAVEFYFLPLSNLVLMSLFFLLGYRLEGIIAAFLLSNIMTLGVLLLFNRKELAKRKDLPLSKKEQLNFLKFSLPLMFANILGTLKNRLDVLLIGFLSTSSNVGIFFVSLKLTAIITIPWQASNMMMAPMISGLFALGEIKSIEHHYKNITKLLFMAATFSGMFLYVFGKNLLLLMGKEYQSGSTVLSVICLGQVIRSLVGHAGPILTMVGKSMLNMTTMMITLVSVVGLNFLLIPRYGIMGAAVANLCGVVIACTLELIFLYTLLKIHPFRLDFIKPLLAALSAWGSVFLLEQLSAPGILRTSVLMAVYVFIFCLVLALQKLTDEELRILLKIKGYTGKCTRKLLSRGGENGV